MTSIEQAEEFHRAFGCATSENPNLASYALGELRLELISEELQELRDALRVRDPVAALDALTDLQYVLDGAFLALGFAKYKDSAFAEVHRSNMSKLGEDGKPVIRADGKILKGPNYSPPDLVKVLESK